MTPVRVVVEDDLLLHRHRGRPRQKGGALSCDNVRLTRRGAVRASREGYERNDTGDDSHFIPFVFAASRISTSNVPEGVRPRERAIFSSSARAISVRRKLDCVFDMLGKYSSLLGSQREQWNRLLGRHDAQSIVGEAAVSFWVVGNATVKVGSPPNATTDQRLQHLQDQIDALAKVDQNLDKRISDEAKAKTDAINALKAETERKQQELWDRVAAMQTGGIRLETVGLVWVAVGSLLPAFS